MSAVLHFSIARSLVEACCSDVREFACINVERVLRYIGNYVSRILRCGSRKILYQMIINIFHRFVPVIDEERARDLSFEPQHAEFHNVRSFL
jgi:Mg2+ and Co2+ transporter CorA